MGSRVVQCDSVATSQIQGPSVDSELRLLSVSVVTSGFLKSTAS